MLPESTAPPLKNMHRFRQFMSERSLEVTRHYVPETEDEDGALSGGFWTTAVWREQELPDGQFWHRYVDAGDAMVERGWEEAWQLLVDNFEKAWAQDMETNAS